jgi:Protein of unknown function (DUF551)
MAMDWQPIDTAPRDRTKVLVCATTVLNLEIRRRKAPIMAVDFWHSRERDGFDGWAHFNPDFYPATHWMPLPKPPATTPGGGGEGE